MADRMTHGTSTSGQHRGQAAGGVLEGVRDTAQEMASNVASTAGQAWDTARQGVQQAASTVADTVGGAWGDLRACMARYPFAVFFAGVGVGALLALALERRWMHGRYQ